MKLSDKVAIVTGAGSGLGRAISLTFEKEGATVIVADINQKGGEETVALAKEGTSEIVYHQLDVCNEASVKILINDVIETYGRVDILINNAGIVIRKSLIEHSLEEWQNVLNVNLTGVFLCTREVVPGMIRRGKGKIINIASIAGLIGYAYPSYCAAKGGVVNLTRGLVLELAPKGINVNCICPGAFRTPINQALMADPVLYQRVVNKIPQKRLGLPKEIGKAALFLASDDSDYINGAILTVDGGSISVFTYYD